jgi:hypothetical protein
LIEGYPFPNETTILTVLHAPNSLLNDRPAGQTYTDSMIYRIFHRRAIASAFNGVFVTFTLSGDVSTLPRGHHLPNFN